MTIKKDELLKLIDEADRIEEEFVTSLAGNIGVATRWAGFSAAENKRIMNSLRILQRDSGEHHRTLSELKAKVMKGAKDVY